MRQFQFKLASDHSVRFKVASFSQRKHKQINIDKTLPSIKFGINCYTTDQRFDNLYRHHWCEFHILQKAIPVIRVSMAGG